MAGLGHFGEVIISGAFFRFGRSVEEKPEAPDRADHLQDLDLQPLLVAAFYSRRARAQGIRQRGREQRPRSARKKMTAGIAKRHRQSLNRYETRTHCLVRRAALLLWC